LIQAQVFFDSGRIDIAAGDTAPQLNIMHGDARIFLRRINCGALAPRQLASRERDLRDD
jgi:hypothetical protein